MRLDELLQNNREWASETEARQPGFFSRLRNQQAPKYLWIGCADSRVPANDLVRLAPGELFVHRNIANIVVHSDLNCLSVIQFASDVLHVEHIIVVGHSNCSGVVAALANERIGLSDNWIRHVKEVRDRHQKWLQPSRKAARRRSLRAQRRRAGEKCLSDDRGPGCVAPWTGTDRPRLGLWTPQRSSRRPVDDRD